MIKIREHIKTEIKVTVPFSADISDKIISDIEAICKNVTPDQLNKLAKVCKNDSLKKMALGALIKFVS